MHFPFTFNTFVPRPPLNVDCNSEHNRQVDCNSEHNRQLEPTLKGGRGAQQDMAGIVDQSLSWSVHIEKITKTVTVADLRQQINTFSVGRYNALYAL